jgi:osmoprotectant transport system permease protein
MVIASVLSSFEDAITFIFQAQESRAGTVKVGGLGEIGHLAGQHVAVSVVALLIGCVVALPLALWLGHIGKGQFLAVSVANIGRAVPSLAIIAFFVAFLGTGFTNVCFALVLLAIPPILTNTYVGVRQVDRDLVDAARGQGYSGAQIVRRIELPLALPTIFGGVRIAAVFVVATATIAPLAGYDTLGTPIISFNVYGSSGQLGAAIVVAVLALAADAGFGGVQRLVTPKGLKVAARGGRRRLRPWSQPTRSVQVP